MRECSRVIFLCNLGFSIYSMLPNELDRQQEEEEEEGEMDDAESVETGKGANWEMQSIGSPASPRGVPFTPRTMAFHTLDRQAPPQREQARFA